MYGPMYVNCLKSFKSFHLQCDILHVYTSEHCGIAYFSFKRMYTIHVWPY